MNFTQFLNEVALTLGGEAYPKFGNVLIMAGGAGSGKGTILNNLILFNGKIMDVDQLKTTILNSKNRFDLDKKFQEYLKSDIPDNKNARELKQQFKNLSINDIDMRNPGHTSLLHYFVINYLNLDNLKKDAFFSNRSRNKDRLPNVIFDVTFRELKNITQAYDYCELAGYDRNNIHLVWVLNDVDIAMVNNKTRSRRIADKPFMDTHIGVSKIMNIILTDLNAKIPNTDDRILDFIKGDIWIVPNVSGKDNKLVFSSKGGKYFERVTKYLIKPKGSNKIMDADDLKKRGIIFMTKDDKQTIADMGTDDDSIIMQAKANKYKNKVFNKISNYVPHDDDVVW